MKLTELAQRNVTMAFKALDGVKVMFFDPDGTLVFQNGNRVQVTRKLLMSDFIIICDHPDIENLNFEVAGGIISIECPKCEQAVRITKLETIEPRIKPVVHMPAPPVELTEDQKESIKRLTHASVDRQWNATT